MGLPAALLLMGPLLLGVRGSAASPTPSYPTQAITERRDWLVEPIPTPTVLRQLDGRTVSLTNGLLARVFTLAPDWSTWDVTTTRGSALRGVSPETTVTLDGISCAIFY